MLSLNLARSWYRTDSNSRTGRPWHHPQPSILRTSASAALPSSAQKSFIRFSSQGSRRSFLPEPSPRLANTISLCSSRSFSYSSRCNNSRNSPSTLSLSTPTRATHFKTSSRSSTPWTNWNSSLSGLHTLRSISKITLAPIRLTRRSPSRWIPRNSPPLQATSSLACFSRPSQRKKMPCPKMTLETWLHPISRRLPPWMKARSSSAARRNSWWSSKNSHHLRRLLCWISSRHL